MGIRIIIMLLLSLSCTMTMGQTRTRFIDKVVGDINMGTGTKCDGLTPIEFSVNLGYRFIPKMYAFVQAGRMYGLYDKNRGESYAKSSDLGGGLGYNFCRTDDGLLELDLRAAAKAGIGSDSWKHVTYDAALVGRIGRSIKINIGIGFRHVSSRTAGIGSYNGLFCTLGFGL